MVGVFSFSFTRTATCGRILSRKSPRWPLASTVELAEGLTHLNSKFFAWVDAHFRNILVTEDLHILADFACSIMTPARLHLFTTCPPPVFACPRARISDFLFVFCAETIP
ncbi:hypothetical protein B0H10DRAFT_2089681 [Mycena sp. CBHHK59/15]|nr:hypothetical protein B0H10DRAFT_2089681 [Mycena sp. CBHHK59/15]